MTGSIPRSIGSPHDSRSSTRTRSRARSPRSAERTPARRAARPIRRARRAAARNRRKVDPLADDLLVAELHGADDHHGMVVVEERVLIDPEVVAAGGPVQ